MVFIFGLYITILTAANLGLMVYIWFERYHAFKKEGSTSAQLLMQEHLKNIGLEEEKILEDFRNSVKTVISNTELSGQQTLEQLNEYMMKSHREQLGKFSEFSAKLYAVLVASGNSFSEQMKGYVSDSNKRIDEWQSSYINVVQHEVDMLIENERQKLREFTEEEKKRIGMYMKEYALKDTSLIVEEVLGNGITVKDQEKLAQQAIEKFFTEV